MDSPKPAKRPLSTTLHGVTWTDEYAWFREKENPELLAHLKAENEYTAALMQPLEPLQQTLFEEIVGRIQQTDLSVPTKEGNYFYYSRTQEGKQYPFYCRKKGSLDAPEELYLDANALAEGLEYFRIGVLETSPDQRLLAYSTDSDGDEDYTIQIQNLEDGTLYPDRIPKTYYAVEWAQDNQTLFYNVLNEAKRPHRVYRHALNSDSSTDELVYEEEDPRFTLNVSKSRSKRFLLLESTSPNTSEIRLLDARNPLSEARIFRERQTEIEYSLTHQEEHLFLRINDRGRNFRLVRCPVDNWGEEHWVEILPHRSDVYLEAVTAFHNYLIVVERENGLRRFRYQQPGSSTWESIEFEEKAYAAGLTGNLDYEAVTLRYQYSSPITPPSVYDFHFATRQHELLKRNEVLGGYDPQRYAVDSLLVRAADGTQVPLITLRLRGLDPSRPHPTLLYGYGSYGVKTDASFSSPRFSLVDRGFIYAIAQVRGGAEMGQPWHDAGKMQYKRNTFTDFIACAEHLIASGDTTPAQLAIEGGSAGGLLVGACVTMRPDLYGAVLAHVPFVDVLNTMLDPSLPLTVGEYEEWGNPEDKPFFDYIRSYSPYDNTRPAHYPQMLLTAGLNDPRVSYWEPAKWAARLRDVNLAPTRITLKVNMGAGHFGASGRYDRFKEFAFYFAWLLQAFGMTEAPTQRPLL
jgi:oligopeptidase B